MYRTFPLNSGKFVRNGIRLTILVPTWGVVVGSFKSVSAMIVREQPLMMGGPFLGKIWSLFPVIPAYLSGVM